MKQRSAPHQSMIRLPEGMEPASHGSARFYMPEENSHIQSKLKLLKRDMDKLGHSISTHSITSGTDPHLQHPGETPLSDMLNYDSIPQRNQFSNQNSSVSHPLLSTSSSQQYFQGSAPETPHLHGEKRHTRSREVPKRLRVDISQPGDPPNHVRRGSLSSSPQVAPLLPKRHIKSPSVLTSEPLPDDPHTHPFMETEMNIETQPFSMSGTLTGSSSLQRFMKSNPGKRRIPSYSRRQEEKTQGSNIVYSSNAGSYNTGQFASTREGKLNNTTSTDTAAAISLKNVKDLLQEEARVRRHEQNSFQPSESSTILRIEEAHASEEQTQRVEPPRKDQAIKLQCLGGNEGQFTQQSSFSFINEQKIKVPENSIQSETLTNNLERLVHTPIVEGLSSILETDGHHHEFNSGVKQLQELRERLDREKKGESID